MISKAVCKMLAVSIALAIVASGIVVNASSTSDISNCTSVNISDADVLTNDQNERLQIQSTSKPDLVIEDIYRKDDRIYYKIKNQGTAEAGVSSSYLYIDGSKRAEDYVASLSSGQTRTESFYTYKWKCSGNSDKIKVCADATNIVLESSGSNNCREEPWSCPKPKTFHGNMTFKELGYETSTYSEDDESVSIDFSSPYEEASGDLNLHLNVLDDGYVEAKINGVTILPEKFVHEGEQFWEKIDIPTGMIDEGTNTLTISFPGYLYEITLLADSTINITEVEPVKGTTFEDLGYDTLSYSEEDESVSIDFDSPYEEVSGDLNLHLNALDSGYIEVKINGVIILSEKRFPEKYDYGEHWEKIDIPTGMIDMGTNTLTISFPDYGYVISLLEDSTINITKVEPVKGTTFEDLGYDTSSYSEEDESVSIDFDSPYEEASGDLNIHLNVLDWGYVEVKINGATILSKKSFDEGEHWEKIDIPTGMIDEGTNTLTISFPRSHYEIALLEDSTINITGTYLTFSYSPENPIIDEIITFNASSAYDDITKYYWDFGDGANAVGEAVTHYYPSSGAYNVTLVVTLDGDEIDTTSKIVGISRWRYDVTVIKESTTLVPIPGSGSGTKNRTMTGLLLMSFTGYESVLGFDACLFKVINTVPGELSDYNITLANTGDYMEKLIEDNYAKLLPINPYEGLRWQDGVSLFSTINIPSSAPTGYTVLGVERVVVPAGNFKCVHVKASYEDNTGSVFKYVDEWWDEEGRGLIQARYENAAGYVGGGSGVFGSTTWEYKLNNSADPLFPINYRGIENETMVSSYTTNPPTIDGTISAGEWTNMTQITLNGYNNPQNTIKGELYVMNDNNNMYIAVVIPDDNQDADYLLLDFDQDNDHVATVGDEDAIGFDLNRFYPRFPVAYTDLYWGAGWWSKDVNAHGNGAQSYEPAHPGVSGEYWYEFVKPLKSGDSQDMALNVDDTVGFRIEVRDGTTGDWYRYPRNTVDADTFRWSEWADLVIGTP